MKIVIHGINHKEQESKKEKGKFYTRCGIKYRGKWYSGFGDEVTKNWDIGDEVDVDLWEEEGKPDENGDVRIFGSFVRLNQSTRPSQSVRPTPAQKVADVMEGEVVDDAPPITEVDLPF